MSLIQWHSTSICLVLSWNTYIGKHSCLIITKHLLRLVTLKTHVLQERLRMSDSYTLCLCSRSCYYSFAFLLFEAIRLPSTKTRNRSPIQVITCPVECNNVKVVGSLEQQIISRTIFHTPKKTTNRFTMLLIWVLHKLTNDPNCKADIRSNHVK